MVLKENKENHGVDGADYILTETDKQEIIEELTRDIEEAKNDFNSNATSKLEEYNLNAENKIIEFNENASSYEERIETNAESIELLKQENIKLKAKDIELEEENKILREDLNNTVPSISGSGENITLNGTSNARFKKFGIGGNSKQETRSGKNLANITKHTNTLDAGTTIIDSNTYQLNLDEENLTTKSWKGSITLKFENLEKNTDYVVSFKYTDGYNTYIKIQGDSVTIIEKYISGYPDGLSFNTGENNVVNVTIYANGSNANATGIITISEIQIEKGAVKTDYEPYGAMPSTEFRSEIRNCGDNINIFPKLEKGTKATPYTPYGTGSINIKIENEDKTKEQNFTFPLSEGQRLYKDSYLADDGIHHKRKQRVLDGTENTWNINVNYTTDDLLVVSVHIKDIKASTINVLSSHFKCNKTSATNTFYIAGTYLLIRLDRTKFDTLDTFKTYLAEQKANGTPVMLEYELEVEEKEEYSEEQQEAYNQIQTAISYKGQTNIFSMNDTKPIFEVEALADIGILLNNMQAQILVGGE